MVNIVLVSKILRKVFIGMIGVIPFSSLSQKTVLLGIELVSREASQEFAV